MGLLATAVTFSFRKPLRLARQREAREQIRFLDASARRYATRFNRPVRMIFDLDANTLQHRDGGPAGRANGGITYRGTLPAGYRIDAVRTADRRGGGGRIVIDCSPLGLSPSYAVHLGGTESQEWMFVAGLSGEVSTFTDERQLDSIFQTLAPR